MRDEKSTSEPVSDAELTRRFREGIEPQAAFEELFHRYAPMTYAFFRRRIGHVEVAAEQNQELYLSVLEHLDRFRGESSFRTWLFRMARNRLSQLRRRWRVHLDEQPEDLADGLWQEIASAETPAPEGAAGRAQVVRRLRRCLALLSEVERAVVLGQYYHDVTLEELSRTLRLVNPTGARAPLLAAQRKLRRCLETTGVSSADVARIE